MGLDELANAAATVDRTKPAEQVKPLSVLQRRSFRHRFRWAMLALILVTFVGAGVWRLEVAEHAQRLRQIFEQEEQRQHSLEANVRLAAEEIQKNDLEEITKAVRDAADAKRTDWTALIAGEQNAEVRQIFEAMQAQEPALQAENEARAIEAEIKWRAQRLADPNGELIRHPYWEETLELAVATADEEKARNAMHNWLVASLLITSSWAYTELLWVLALVGQRTTTPHRMIVSLTVPAMSISAMFLMNSDAIISYQNPWCWLVMLLLVVFFEWFWWSEPEAPRLNEVKSSARVVG